MVVIDCSCSQDCFTIHLKCNGHIIFYSSVAVIAALSFIIAVLSIAICCICCRYRKRKSFGIHTRDNEEEIKSGKKGDALQMTKVGRELVTGKDIVYEEFPEEKYAKDKCSQHGRSTSHYVKQPSNVDTVTDGAIYDIITHIDEYKIASGEKSSESTAKESKNPEKRDLQVKPGVEAEYSVPDLSQKKKKPQTSVACNTVTVQHDIAVPLPTLSEYSVIGPEDIKRARGESTLSSRSSGHSQDGRQRRRTSSSPEEPPPLPPPYVDKEKYPGLQFDTASTSTQTEISGREINHQHGGNLGGIYQTSSTNSPEYDVPDCPIASGPQQENVYELCK